MCFAIFFIIFVSKLQALYKMTKKPLTCIIVDDDSFSRETLEDLLFDIKNIKLLKSLGESSMAIKYLATLKPDIVFLDINMPEKNGISVLDEINTLAIDTKVIFITAHQDYILDAFKKNAFDYLLKPINKSELDETLNRLFNEEDQNSAPVNQNSIEEKIIIQNSRGSLILDADAIAYIKADGCYTTLFLTENKTEVVSKNIGKIQHLFKQPTFFKISRSGIVNTQYINRIDRARKNIHIFYNGNSVVLKASKELLYDLEHFIHQMK